MMDARNRRAGRQVDVDVGVMDGKSMVILGLGWGGNEEARRNCQAFREELEGGGSGCPQVRSIDRRMNAGGDSRPQEDPCVRNTEPPATVAFLSPKETERTVKREGRWGPSIVYSTMRTAIAEWRPRSATGKHAREHVDLLFAVAADPDHLL